MEKAEILGEVDAHSGTIVIADESKVGVDPLENIAVEVGNIRQNGPITVTAERTTEKWSSCPWREVYLDVQPGAKKAWSESAGKIKLEGTGILLLDEKSISSWQHWASLDGKSDLIFSGRDAKDVSSSVGAEETEEGFGWVDLPTHECEKKRKAVELIKAQNGREIQIDCVPHSHHHQAVSGMSKSINGTAQLKVGNTKVLSFLTGLPEGEYPVFRDLDGHGNLVRVRIQLASEAEKPVGAPAAAPEKAQAVEVIEGEEKVEQSKVATKTGDEPEPEGEDMAKKKKGNKKSTKKSAAKKTGKKRGTKKSSKKTGKTNSAKKGRGSRHTKEEKSALVDKYHKLITDGKAAASAAAKQVGISYQTLLKWEKELGKKLKKKRGRKPSAAPKKAATSRKARGAATPRKARGAVNTTETAEKAAKKKSASKKKPGRKPKGQKAVSAAKELKKAFATPKKGTVVHASPSGGPISIVTPSGFRIEGLHTDDVIRVLNAVK